MHSEEKEISKILSGNGFLTRWKVKKVSHWDIEIWICVCTLCPSRLLPDYFPCVVTVACTRPNAISSLRRSKGFFVPTGVKSRAGGRRWIHSSPIWRNSCIDALHMLQADTLERICYVLYVICDHGVLEWRRRQMIKSQTSPDTHSSLPHARSWYSWLIILLLRHRSCNASPFSMFTHPL